MEFKCAIVWVHALVAVCVLVCSGRVARNLGEQGLYLKSKYKVFHWLKVYFDGSFDFGTWHILSWITLSFPDFSWCTDTWL